MRPVVNQGYKLFPRPFPNRPAFHNRTMCHSELAETARFTWSAHFQLDRLRKAAGRPTVTGRTIGADSTRSDRERPTRCQHSTGRTWSSPAAGPASTAAGRPHLVECQHGRTWSSPDRVRPTRCQHGQHGQHSTGRPGASTVETGQHSTGQHSTRAPADLRKLAGQVSALEGRPCARNAEGAGRTDPPFVVSGQVRLPAHGLPTSRRTGPS
jgi:hypothetical protein